MAPSAGSTVNVVFVYPMVFTAKGCLKGEYNLMGGGIFSDGIKMFFTFVFHKLNYAALYGSFVLRTNTIWAKFYKENPGGFTLYSASYFCGQ